MGVGVVRVGPCRAMVTGRKAATSLYDDGLATYSHGDTFDRTAAVGFLKLYGLPYRTVASVRRKNGDDPLAR